MLKSLGVVAGLMLMMGSAAQGEEKLPTTVERIPKTTVDFELVKIPAGKITLKDKEGKEKEHQIKSIWIGKKEVTWPEYEYWYLALDLPANQRDGVKSDKKAIRSRPSVPYNPPDRGWGRDNSPVGSVFCREAKRYCEWLSAQTGKTYRLATEAEWEYACRAGGPPVKPQKAQLKEMAWFDLNSDSQTHPCGEKKANAWGLVDMLGNVAEWVTTMDGGEAVAGGSFNDAAEDVHSGARDFFHPRWQATDPQEPKGRSWLSDGPFAGFRIVREE